MKQQDIHPHIIHLAFNMGAIFQLGVDLERAYDRRDIVLPLSTEARLAVILARQAFELDARADAALFATAPALRRRAVCLTERDRATLEDHGARARATVPVILVALDA